MIDRNIVKVILVIICVMFARTAEAGVYTNRRFGFSVEVPSDSYLESDESHNGDGKYFRALEDSRVEARFYAGYNVFDSMGHASFLSIREGARIKSIQYEPDYFYLVCEFEGLTVMIYKRLMGDVIYTATYTAPTEKLGRYHPEFEGINGTWKIGMPTPINSSAEKNNDVSKQDFSNKECGVDVEVPMGMFERTEYTSDGMLMSFVSKKDRDVKFEFLADPMPYHEIEDMAIRLIAPGTTIVRIDNEYDRGVQDRPMFTLIYDRDNGITEMIFMKVVADVEAKGRFLFTAHYALPTYKVGEYETEIYRINSTWEPRLTTKGAD